MRKIFKCKLSYSFYHPVGICFTELNNLFFLDDMPVYVDIIVTDKPSPNSYEVKIWRSSSGWLTGINGVKVKYSSGDWQEIYTSGRTDDILKTLPNTFYVSVMA